KVVTLAGAGQVTAGLVSAEVAALAGGVLRDMLLNKLRTMAVVLLPLVLLGGGLWGNHLVGGNDSTEVAPLVRGRFPVEEGLVLQFNPVAAPPLVVNNDDFIQLFNGKDLTGWKKDPAWSVKDGILTGSGDGFLATTSGPYHDFHLRAKARISDGGKG